MGGSWIINDLGEQPKDIVAMACGDADNDAQDEIYYSYLNGGNVTKLSYDMGWKTEGIGGVGFKTISLAVCDLGSDGRNELYSGDEDAHIYRYDLFSTWNITDEGEQSDDVLALACGDGNNDGRDDLYFGVRNDANLYELLSNGSVRNNGGIGFKVSSICVGDAEPDPQGYNEIYIGDDNYNIYKYVLPYFELSGRIMEIYNDGGVILVDFL